MAKIRSRTITNRRQINAGLSSTVELFRGQPLHAQSIINDLMRDQMSYANDVASLYLFTMLDFDSGSPEAGPIVISKDRDGRRVNVYVRGDYANIYRYLDFGAIRKVRLTSDFSRSTQPHLGIQGSNPGAGGVVVRKGGKFNFLPRSEWKEIEPRDFTKEIAAEVEGHGGQMIQSYGDYMRAEFKAHMRREKGHA